MSHKFISVMEEAMAKSTQKLNKKTRRVLAKKKAKQRKILIIAGVFVLLLAIASVVYVSTTVEARTIVYSDGSQVVRLRPNGRFSADLSHGARFRGTYTVEDEGRWKNISFTERGVTIYSMIMDENLIIPEEWQDACQHNTMLPRRAEER